MKKKKKKKKDKERNAILFKTNILTQLELNYIRNEIKLLKITRNT